MVEVLAAENHSAYGINKRLGLKRVFVSFTIQARFEKWNLKRYSLFLSKLEYLMLATDCHRGHWYCRDCPHDKLIPFSLLSL